MLDEVKGALTGASRLLGLGFDKPFKLVIDVCVIGVGGLLAQGESEGR